MEGTTMSANYERLSELISVNQDDSTEFLVNNEWTYKIPSSVKHYIDHEFDDGIEGGIDLMGSKKPMVLQGFKTGTSFLFNVALQKHYDFFGNYNTIIDCKYDNRASNANSGASHDIIIDTDTLYVDVMSVNAWPLGVDLQVRVRGSKISPFNFATMVNGLDKNDFSKVIDLLKTIATSIRLKSFSGTETKSTNKAKPATTSITKLDDPTCVIEGTVLRKFIGSDVDIILPDGLTEIADNTFSGRADIKSIVVPEGVKVIGSRVFENCFGLEKVVLPSTLKKLGDYSFVDCHKLKKISLGNNLTVIEDSMFSECFELEDIQIPEKVKHIKAFAFKNCASLTSLVLPNRVESIGYTAFTNCSNLKHLFIPASVTSINDNYFGDTPFGGCNNLTIHCPSGSRAESYCKDHNIRFIKL